MNCPVGKMIYPDKSEACCFAKDFFFFFPRHPWILSMLLWGAWSAGYDDIS